MIFDKKKLLDAAEYFTELAKQYTVGEGGLHRPKPFAPKNPAEDFPSLRQRFQKSSFLNGFQEFEINGIAFKLGKEGFHRFSYVAEGENAQVYESNDVIVRVTPHPNDDEYAGVQRTLVRNQCPLLLQADGFHQARRSRVRVEKLPYLVMAETESVPDIFEDVAKKSLEGTQFSFRPHSLDVGVFPDGTPVCVDPGMIRYRPAGRDLSEDFALIAANVKKLELPEPFSWVSPNGRFKQDAFFLKP